MKLSPFFYIVITTLILVTITIMASLNMAFNWVFYLTVVGQILVVIMVYKVLTDKYTTNKTFEHYYEDRPVKPLDDSRKGERLR